MEKRGAAVRRAGPAGHLGETVVADTPLQERSQMAGFEPYATLGNSTQPYATPPTPFCNFGF